MPPQQRLDTALIRKYAIPGPRYTSYPAATCFTADYSSEDALGDLRGGDSGAPVSIYVHLPFCHQLCWYCGCNTIISRNPADADRYLDDLEREIALVARQVAVGEFEQLHLGGGTPTFLGAEQIRRLGKIIRAHFSPTVDAEISVEVDPRQLVGEQAAALAELGMNRASIGVQDTDPAVQAAVHREQPHALNHAAAACLRAHGVRSINVDLIYGLPRQSVRTLGRTLDEILEISPERFSVFSYAHVPWMKPAQKILERDKLPSPEEKLEMFAFAYERLRAEGYVDVGLDHFARPEDELARALGNGSLHRNFQGYSTRAGASLVGLGVSSISSTATSYRQNFRGMDKYRAALDEGRLPVERGLKLTDEDVRRREIIMRIMCGRRLDFAEVSEKIGVDFERVYAGELGSLSDLAEDGIVVVGDGSLSVTEKGVPLLRVVAMRFDGHFRPTSCRHAMSV